MPIAIQSKPSATPGLEDDSPSIAARVRPGFSRQARAELFGISIALLILLVAGPSSSQDFDFEWLGELNAAHVSDDGSTIAGVYNQSSLINVTSFIWRRGESTVRVPGTVAGMSADGQTLVGSLRTSTRFVAVRWDRDGTQTELSGASAFSFEQALVVSEGGGSIVGHARIQGYLRPVRWNAFGRFPMKLPTGLGGLVMGTPTSISRNGLTIGGTVGQPDVLFPYVWDRPNQVPTRVFAGVGAVLGIADDGIAAVGTAGSMPSRAFVRGSDGVVRDAGSLPGTVRSRPAQANAISADGTLVVGWAHDAVGQRAFVRTEAQGMEAIELLMAKRLGLVLPDYTLFEATAISGDGVWIVGRGRHDGVLDSWILRLGDSDQDGYSDLVDNCIHLPTGNRSDRDGDGLGDACDAFPDRADHALASCEVDRATAEDEVASLGAQLASTQDELAICLQQPTASDTDGDGEPDLTDRCPSTGAGETIDEAGCSQPQFCAAQGRSRRGLCSALDFRNDEPQRAPRDCEMQRRSFGRTCVSSR